MPNAAAIATAQGMVNEIYKDQLTKKSFADQDALAKQMFADAQQSAGQPDGQFVLLREARDRAIHCGDLPVAMDAINRVAAMFVVNPQPMIEQALTQVAQTPSSLTTPEITRRTAGAEFALSRQALGEGEFELAANAASAAKTSAQHVGDAALLEQINSILPSLQSMATAFAAARPALDALEKNPNDPAANLVAGRFVCFSLEEWDRGLPMLARSNDPILAKLAKQELAPPQNAAARAAMGDAWLAAAKTSDAKDAMERRAAFWYAAALNDLTGLSRLAIQKRLTDIRTAHLQPGLIAEFFTGLRLQRRLVTRVDPMVEYDWKGQSPEVGIPGEGFSARWSGWIKAPVSGSYQFVLVHDDGVRVWIDGQQIMDQWRNVARDKTTADLSAGLHELRIEYQQLDGESKLGLGWMPPGTKQVRAVPPNALFHEPLTIGMQLPSQIEPDSAGVFHLTAAYADLHGPKIHVGGGGDLERVGNWNSMTNWISWDVSVPAGIYQVALRYGCDGNNAGGEYAISAGPAYLKGDIEDTGDWSRPHEDKLGRVDLSGGPQTITLQAVKMPHGGLMDVFEVTLTPVRR